MTRSREDIWAISAPAPRAGFGAQDGRRKERNDEMKRIAYIFKRIGDCLIFLTTVRGAIAKQAVDADICDFSGQGRDKYGLTCA